MTTHLEPDVPQQGVHWFLSREYELARSCDEVALCPAVSLQELLALGCNLLQQPGYCVGFLVRHVLLGSATPAKTQRSN